MFYAPFPSSYIPFFRLSGFLPTESAVTVYLCCVSSYPRALLNGGPRWTGCKGFQTCPVSIAGWVIWTMSPAMLLCIVLGAWEVRLDVTVAFSPQLSSRPRTWRSTWDRCGDTSSVSRRRSSHRSGVWSPRYFIPSAWSGAIPSSTAPLLGS